MKTVKRVNKKDFEGAIEDKQTEGYGIASQSDRQANMVKRTYGKAMWHILILIFTVWWTFGIGNLAYFLYCYFVHKEEAIIKIK